MLGEEIRKLRKSKKITQKKLSILSGIPEITIRQYEAGKYAPTIKPLEKIAEALGVTINYFLSKETIKTRKLSAALEAFITTLETVYDVVTVNHHYVINSDGEKEYDGEYDVYLEKDGKEFYLSKQSYEALFNFICSEIPKFINTIEEYE